jgi:hypothetical protein
MKKSLPQNFRLLIITYFIVKKKEKDTPVKVDPTSAMVCKMFEIGYPKTSFHVTQVHVMHSWLVGFVSSYPLPQLDEGSTRARIKKNLASLTLNITI